MGQIRLYSQQTLDRFFERNIKTDEQLRELCDVINNDDITMITGNYVTFEELKLENEAMKELQEHINCKLTNSYIKRYGKWEYVQYDGNPEIGNWYCSECKFIPCSQMQKEIKEYDFCPKCGCDMRKVINT